MPSCCIKNCKTNYKNKGKDISLHRFPNLMKDKWIEAIKDSAEIATISHTSVICSKHFDKEDFLPNGAQKRIREGAIPTLFLSKKVELLTPLTLQSAKQEKSPLSPTRRTCLYPPRRTCISPTKSIPLSPTKSISSTKSSLSSNEIKRRVMILKEIHNYSHSPTYMRKSIVKERKRSNFFRNKYRNSIKTNKRLKRKVSDLQHIIKELKSKSLITENAEIDLNNSLSGIPLAFMRRLLTKTKSGTKFRKAYPKELKSFAITLQYYSPRAYEYVRSTFNHNLPHQSVIRRWYSKINCEPGYSETAIIHLTRMSGGTHALSSSIMGEYRIC